jgi:fibronectin type 3 domain-containing protein
VGRGKAKIVTVPPLPPTGPAAPALLAVTASLSGITLAWSDADGSVAGYLIYSDSSQTGSFANLVASPSAVTTSYTDITAAVGATTYYRLIAVDGSGNQSAPATGNAFRPAPDATPPGAPGNFAATASTSGVALSWDANTERDLAALPYRLYHSTDGVTFATLGSAQSGTTATDTTGAPGAVYTYGVTASDATGNESAKSTLQAARLASAPAVNAPTGLRITARTTTSLTLGWTAATGGPDGYNVYYSTSPAGPFTKANLSGVIAATTYTVTGLASGTIYWIDVKSSTSGTESAPAQINGAVYQRDVSPPDQPQGLTTTGNSSTIALAWAANTESDLAGYNVYRSLQQSSGFATLANVTAPTHAYTDSAATIGVVTFYRVTALDSSGNESLPALVSATRPTLPQPPAAPTNFTAITAGYGVSLTWSTPAGATGYHLYRGTDGTTFTLLVSPTATTYNDATATTGATNYYRLTATNGAGESAGVLASAFVPSPDTTPPGKPAGLTATESTAGVTLKWTGNTERDLARYDVYRSPDGSTWDEISGALAIPTHFDGTGVAGTVYFYGVSATDTSGNQSARTTITAARLVTPTPTAAPGAVVSLRVLTFAGSSLTLAWSVPTTGGSPTGYKVSRATAANGPFTLLATATATSYSDSGLNPATVYFYTVVATNAGGDGPATGINTAAYVRDTTPPNPPQSVVATGQTNNIHIAWKANSETDLGQYQVARGTSAAGPFTFLSISPAGRSPYFDDQTAVTGTSYVYQVKAVDTSGNVSTGTTSNPATASASVITPGVFQVLVNGAMQSASATPIVLTQQAPATVVCTAVPCATSDLRDWEFAWDFGDTTSTSEYNAVMRGWQAVHQYRTPGPYTITLTITAPDFSVTVQTQGVSVKADSRTPVYVDAVAGSDGNSGSTTAAPVKTLAKAKSLLDSNVRLMLKRGQVHTWDYNTDTASFSVKGRNVLVCDWGDPAQAKPRIFLANARHAGPQEDGTPKVTAVEFFVDDSGSRDSTIENLWFDTDWTAAKAAAQGVVWSSEKKKPGIGWVPSGSNQMVRNCSLGNTSGYGKTLADSAKGATFMGGDQLDPATNLPGDTVTGNQVFLGAGRYHNLIGCTFADNLVEPLQRFQNSATTLSDLYVAFNDTSVPSGGSKEGLTIRLADRVYVYGNVITDSIKIQVGPANQPNQFANMIVVDGNLLTDTNMLVAEGAHQVCYRNNVITFTNPGSGVVGFDFSCKVTGTLDGGVSTVYSQTHDVRVWHNTAVFAGTTGHFMTVEGGNVADVPNSISPYASNFDLRNNLLVAPNWAVKTDSPNVARFANVGRITGTAAANNVWGAAERVQYLSAGVGTFSVLATDTGQGYLVPLNGTETRVTSTGATQVYQGWNAATGGNDTYAAVTLDGSYSPAGTTANVGTRLPGCSKDRAGNARPSSGVTAGAVNSH